MFGRSKLILAAGVITLAVDSAASSCGTLPTGPDCYADDRVSYHSLYSDWRGIVGSPSQRHRPSRKHGHKANDDR